MPASTSFDLKGSDTRWHACDQQSVWYDSSQEHWIGALLRRVPLLPTAQYALNTAIISEGIYLSSREGRELSAREIRDQSVSTAIDPYTPEKAWSTQS
jgi:hypothetical protein